MATKVKTAVAEEVQDRMAKSDVKISGWQWGFTDIFNTSVIIVVHCLSLLGPFYFNWDAFYVAIVLYYITGFGVTIGYHRNLSHQSFKFPKWLEYLFAYCGVLSLQGSPIDWVSTHRHHHKVADTSSDPHTPIKGLWTSYIGWLSDYCSRFHEGRFEGVGDMASQSFYMFLHYTYGLHSVALGVLLYAIGGLPFLVWGLGVRVAVTLHVTLAVNTFCHQYGKRVFETDDLSTNNGWLSWLALGEGWHNNHHAFEYSARQGLEWWEIDISWYIIRFLQGVGLATDVKLPTELQKKRKRIYTTEDHNGKAS